MLGQRRRTLVDTVGVYLFPESYGYWARTEFLKPVDPRPTVIKRIPARQVGRDYRLHDLDRGLCRILRSCSRSYQPISGFIIAADARNKGQVTNPLLEVTPRTFARLAPHLTIQSLCEDDVFATHTAIWLQAQGADPDAFKSLAPDFLGTSAALIEASGLLAAL